MFASEIKTSGEVTAKKAGGPPANDLKLLIQTEHNQRRTFGKRKLEVNDPPEAA